MKRVSFVVLSCMMIAVFVGCSSAPKVTRGDVGEVTDLSGFWNDTDSRLVAEEVIESCLNGKWLDSFQKSKGADPVVIVGTVKNQSHEHINTSVFVTDLEQALINAGKVRFVASKEERFEVRAEREDQKLGYTNAETIKAHGNESGADFMLKGSVNSIKDQIKGKFSVFYQVNLELVDLSTNEKVWIGQKKIKKTVSKSSWKM